MVKRKQGKVRLHSAFRKANIFAHASIQILAFPQIQLYSSKRAAVVSAPRGCSNCSKRLAIDLVVLSWFISPEHVVYGEDTSKHAK